MTIVTIHRYKQVINEIASFNWSRLTRDELMRVAGAYYYYSVHFCETVDKACEIDPADPKLAELREGECDTNNLSPYPGVAKEGERMNHDEFMRRVFAMTTLDQPTRDNVERLGRAFLAQVRSVDQDARIMSLPTYEDGGLERVFRAILNAPDWDEPSLGAFKHFLVGHIALDSDPDKGHGSLCRHLVPDDRVLPLWTAFRDLLVTAAPRLAN